jgi:hypothetical protein
LLRNLDRPFPISRPNRRREDSDADLQLDLDSADKLTWTTGKAIVPWLIYIGVTVPLLMRAHNKERSGSSVEVNRTDDTECSCPTSVFVFFHSFSESHIFTVASSLAEANIEYCGWKATRVM